MPDPPPRPTLISIQCLRGVAAVLVVLLHAHTAVAIKFPGQSALNEFFFLRRIGAVGVDIFFVISGFIMVLVNHEKFGRPQAALDFLVRRAIRIVPLYWLMSALMVLLLVFLPQAFGMLTFRLGQAIESFLFIPTTNSAGEFVPVLAVGWTLSYEVLFYVAFASMLPTSLRTSLALTAVVFGIAAGISYLRTSTGPLDSMLFSDLLLEFVLGEWVALWVLRRDALAPRTSRLLLALALTVFGAHVFIGDLRVARLLSTGLPAAALVLALVSLDRREPLRLPAWLTRVGDESYSLYLSHLITNSVFFKLCVATHVDRFVPVDVLIPLAVLNAVGWGHLLHRWVERPMTQRLTRAWQRRLTAAGRSACPAERRCPLHR